MSARSPHVLRRRRKSARTHEYATPAVQVGWTVDDNGGGHFLRVGWRWGGDIWVPLAHAEFESATGAVNYSDEDNARAAALAVGGRVCKLMMGKPPT